jgi:hypothetical protein
MLRRLWTLANISCGSRHDQIPISAQHNLAPCPAASSLFLYPATVPTHRDNKAHWGRSEVLS